MAPLARFRSTNLPWIAAGCIALLLGAFGCWTFVRRASQPDAPLTIPQEFLNFGRVAAQDAFVWPLKIKNGGPRDVEISGLKALCSCMTVTPRSLVVPGGGEEVVCLTIDLRSDRPAPPDAPRPFSVALEGTARPALQPARPVQWHIQGEVFAPFSVTPPVLRMRSTGDADLATLQAEVRSHVDAHDVIAKADGDAVDVRLAAADDRRTFNLSVTPKPGLRPGDHRFRVTLQAKDADGDGLPPLSVDGCVTIVASVAAAPQELVFGAIEAGALVDGLVVLSSQMQESFTVSIDAPLPQGVSVEELGACATSRTYHLGCRRRDAGPRTDRVTFRVTTDSGRREEITVSIFSHALAATSPQAKLTRKEPTFDE